MAPTKQPKPDLATRQAEIDAVLAEMAAARERTRNFTTGAPITPSDIPIAGCWGTAVAGGFYPTVVFVLDGLVQQTFSRLDLTGIFLVVVTVGFAIGFIFTTIVGISVFGACVFAARFCKISVAWNTHISVMAGGVTAMICAMPIQAFVLGDFFSRWMGNLAFATAIIMGQIGAWRAASKRARTAALSSSAKVASTAIEVRFRLGHLFRITTVVCIAAAGLAALDLSPQTYRVLAFGLLVQAVAFAAILLAGRVRPQRAAATKTLPPGVEEANHGCHR